MVAPNTQRYVKDKWLIVVARIVGAPEATISVGGPGPPSRPRRISIKAFLDAGLDEREALERVADIAEAAVDGIASYCLDRFGGRLDPQSQSSSQLKRPPNGSRVGIRIGITFCTGGGLRGRRGSVHQPSRPTLRARRCLLRSQVVECPPLKVLEGCQFWPQIGR